MNNTTTKPTFTRDLRGYEYDTIRMITTAMELQNISAQLVLMNQYAMAECIDDHVADLWVEAYSIMSKGVLDQCRLQLSYTSGGKRAEDDNDNDDVEEDDDKVDCDDDDCDDDDSSYYDEDYDDLDESSYAYRYAGFDDYDDDDYYGDDDDDEYYDKDGMPIDPRNPRPPCSYPGFRFTH